MYSCRDCNGGILDTVWPIERALEGVELLVVSRERKLFFG